MTAARRCQDTNHVHTNAIAEACTAAGYKPCLEMFVVAANFEYGPFSKSQFHQNMVEAVVEMSTNMDANDGLLLKFWPSICADYGWTGSEQTGKAAREQFLRDMPANKVYASMQRWGIVASQLDWT